MKIVLNPLMPYGVIALQCEQTAVQSGNVTVFYNTLTGQISSLSKEEMDAQVKRIQRALEDKMFGRSR